MANIEDERFKRKTELHSRVLWAIESYIPYGKAYDAERNELRAWVDKAAAALYAADEVVGIDVAGDPPDRCVGCDVALNTRLQHAVNIGDRMWHSTCAVKALRSHVERVEGRNAEHKMAITAISLALSVASQVGDRVLDAVRAEISSDDSPAMVRALVSRHRQLVELTRDHEKMCALWQKLERSEASESARHAIALEERQAAWSRVDAAREEIETALDRISALPTAEEIAETVAELPMTPAEWANQVRERARTAKAMRDQAAQAVYNHVGSPLTIDQVYPVCATPLGVMRDPTRTAFDRIDAAKILIEMGLADHPLMLDDVRAAARGELGRMRSPAGLPITLEIEAPRSTPACADLVAFVDGELSDARALTFRDHLRRCEGCRTGLTAATALDARFSEMRERNAETVLLRPAPVSAAPPSSWPARARVALAFAEACVEIGNARDAGPNWIQVGSEEWIQRMHAGLRSRLGPGDISVRVDPDNKIHVAALGCEMSW